MKIRANFFIAFLLLFSAVQVKASEPVPYEMPQTYVVPVKNSQADRQYELYIRLPKDYSDTAETPYPVIYVTDGAWSMEMLAGATKSLMPNAIVVGLSWQTDLGEDRPHLSRFRDYTLVPSTNPERQARYHFGQASHYLSFLRKDVISYVESHYHADPSKRAFYGYSAGGELGAYILLAQPDTFHHYILGSPSFDSRSIDYIAELDASISTRQSTTSTNVFVSIGELETREIEYARRFVQILNSRSSTGLKLTGLEIIENSDHGTASPETAIRGIKWLSHLTSE